MAAQSVSGSESQKGHDLVEDSKIVAPSLPLILGSQSNLEPRNRGIQRA